VGFFSRWFGNRRSAPGGADRHALHFYVQCAKCGERLHVRVVPQTDAYLDYAAGSEQGVRTLHKEILGSACQNLMYLHVILDSADRVVESSTERCTLISRDQFEAAQAGPGA
jgi:hypothetical protein